MTGNRSPVALTVLALAIATVQADTYYVSPSGLDRNPGTKDKPFLTVGKAAAVARAGDTILLRAGTYNEGVVLARSGEPDKPITLKNYPAERPVIEGALDQKRH